MAALLLIQEPPLVASDRLLLEPAHTFVFPVIGATVIGGLITNIIEATARHPLLLVTV